MTCQNGSVLPFGRVNPVLTGALRKTPFFGSGPPAQNPVKLER